MGSQVDSKDEITVLVTGFGPFREQYPVNPSWEIVKSLPAYLPPLRPKDPHARTLPPTPEVRIITNPEPIRVNYNVVRSLVPSFWDGPYQGRNIDLAIHIGMAGPTPFYQVERRAHRTGYKSKDVDGERPEDEEEEAAEEEEEEEEGDEEGTKGEDWIWRGLPDELLSDLDIPDIVERLQGHSQKGLDIRMSDDAGRYLCDFIYYSSLAHLRKKNRPGKVTFLHVPSDASDRSVEQGRELALNLVRSIVESEMERRRAKLQQNNVQA